MFRNYKELEKKLKKLNQLIYNKQKREIEKLYNEISDSLDKKLYNYNIDNFSEFELKQLQKELKSEVKNNRKKISTIIDENLGLIIASSALLHSNFFKKIDYSYGTNLTTIYKEKTKKVEKEVKKKVTSAEIYKDNYKLSQRIWGDNKKVLSDIDKILNEGLKNKKDPYSIAKDLEKYVNPSAKKDWSWSTVYPGSNKKVDYNAQRLARTTLTHAHQIATQEYANKNPFIEYLVYNCSYGARTCEMCADRDGQLFKKDDVPLDHPNGNCFMTVYIPDNLTDMIAQMANEGTLEDYLEDL